MKNSSKHVESRKARQRRHYIALKSLRLTQEKYYETKTPKQAKIKKTLPKDRGKTPGKPGDNNARRN